MSRIKNVKPTHLTVKPNGEMSWDWNLLLEEVRQAISNYKPSKDLVVETETKLKKTRKKK